MSYLRALAIFCNIHPLAQMNTRIVRHPCVPNIIMSIIRLMVRLFVEHHSWVWEVMGRKGICILGRERITIRDSCFVLSVSCGIHFLLEVVHRVCIVNRTDRYMCRKYNYIIPAWPPNCLFPPNLSTILENSHNITVLPMTKTVSRLLKERHRRFLKQKTQLVSKLYIYIFIYEATLFVWSYNAIIYTDLTILSHA